MEEEGRAEGAMGGGERDFVGGMVERIYHSRCSTLDWQRIVASRKTRKDEVRLLDYCVLPPQLAQLRLLLLHRVGTGKNTG